MARTRGKNKKKSKRPGSASRLAAGSKVALVNKADSSPVIRNCGHNLLLLRSVKNDAVQGDLPVLPEEAHHILAFTGNKEGVTLLE